MKKLYLFTLMLFTVVSYGQKMTQAEKEALIKKNPFNAIYPEMIMKQADSYFDETMKLYSDSPIDEKNTHLIGLAAAVVTKCQYCIPYHIKFAKKSGATDEEIKVALQISAEVMRMSTLFYGNEFDLEAFKASLK